MGRGSCRFRPVDRLLRSSDFRRVSQRGRRVISEAFVMLVDEVPEGPRMSPRLGIIVSRKLGNAVVRNRLKRRIREWFRNKRSELQLETDIVVIGRSRCATLGTGEIEGILCRMSREVNARRR